MQDRRKFKRLRYGVKVEISYYRKKPGDTDVIISIRARNIKELYDFVIEVLGQIPGVHRTETYLLPLNIKNVTTWMPPFVFEDERDYSSDDSHHDHGE